MKGEGYPRHATVYWVTRNGETIRRIRERFHLPAGTNVRGETPALIRTAEDWELLAECERRGYIQIRIKRTDYQ